MRADIERQKPARARAGQIRSGITNYVHTLGVIAQAYQERDWETLGYDSWQRYIDGEFPAARLGIPAEYREKAMVDLRLAGLSTRAIAPVVGVHHSTVARQVSQDATPEPIQGVDGKTYSPARSPLVEAITGAIEDAAERIETAGLAGPAPDAEQASTASGTAAAGEPAAPAAAPQDQPAEYPCEGAEYGVCGGEPHTDDCPASDHPGSSNPGEGAGSAPAPAAGGAASTMPPAAPHSPSEEPAAPGEPVEEQGGPATSPAGPPCEKCGAAIATGQAAEGYTRCDDCDPDGEHVDHGEGCRGCRIVAETDPAYVLSFAENEHGLHLECGECDGVVAHLKPGGSLPEVLAAAREHHRSCS